MGSFLDLEHGAYLKTDFKELPHCFGIITKVRPRGGRALLGPCDMRVGDHGKSQGSALSSVAWYKGPLLFSLSRLVPFLSSSPTCPIHSFILTDLLRAYFVPGTGEAVGRVLPVTPQNHP